MSHSQPRLEEHLFNLSPRGRMIGGVVMLVLGVGTAIGFWGMGLLWYGSVFCVLLGPALFVTGWRDQQKQQRIDREVARAMKNWEELRRDLAEARSKKVNVARLLQERGYREFAVRQWINRELGSSGGR